MTAVTTLLDRLATGDATLDEAAEALPAALNDSDDPGTFGEVAEAFATARIDSTAFAVLTDAVGKSLDGKATTATTGPGGQVEAVGATSEDPDLHQLHEDRLEGTQPAKDATPKGAEAYFLADDGSDAWIATVDGKLVGFMRRAGAEAVRYEDMQKWVADVDALRMEEHPPPQQSTDGATKPAADDPPGSPAAVGGADEPKAGKAADAAAPPINRGSFVAWNGGSGRVDLVVTNGTVPGVDGDVEGTADGPAARVVVWEETDGAWTATTRKIGYSVRKLRRIAPLTRGKKSAPGWDAVLDALAEHDAAIEVKVLPPTAAVDGPAVEAVYERGLDAWPGESKTVLTAAEWATGRVQAFLTKAAGDDVPGYTADDDLLPGGAA